MYFLLELNPDFSPKWGVLSEILKTEIPLELEKEENRDVKPKILILCQDTKTCFQLNQYLSEGPEKYLFMMAIKKEVKFKKISKKFFKARPELIEKYHSKESSDKPKKSKKDEPPTDLETLLEDKLFEELDEDFEMLRSSFLLTMSQIGDRKTTERDDEEENEGNDKNIESSYAFEPFREVCIIINYIILADLIVYSIFLYIQMENMDLSTIERSEPVILIQTFKTDGNILSLQTTLDDFQPNFIIMYHSNMTAIRQIEV